MDTPNAFAQTAMPEKEAGEERVTMKIAGVPVDMLINIDPELCGPHVACEKGRKALCVLVLRAIYGMLQATLLWHNKFREDLEKEESSLICMIHVQQVARRRDHNMLLHSTQTTQNQVT